MKVQLWAEEYLGGLGFRVLGFRVWGLGFRVHANVPMRNQAYFHMSYSLTSVKAGY